MSYAPSLAYPEVSESNYRPDVDGLRAVAVLCVVTFHAFPEYLRGGFVGVDIFFVISGFLITSLIIRGLANDTFSFVQFYQRRIRRIFPALLLVLAACFLFGRFALFTGENQQLGKHIIGGTSFVSNFVLWSEKGYFDNSADTKPLLHLWSLGIEEQFYIVWPAILWAAFKCRVNFLTVIILIALASFALNVNEASRHATTAFYSPQTRFWELLWGASLAWASTRAKGTLDSLSPVQSSCLSICGFTLVFAGILLITNESVFPGWWALLPTTGALLIITAGRDAVLNRVVLSNRFLVWIGLISFPLYLWHWPLLSLARILKGGDPSPSVRAVLVLVSLMLAWLSFKLLEYPIRRGGNARLKTVSLVLVALAIGSLGYLQYNFATYAMNAVEAQFVGPSTPWKYDVNDACQKRFPFEGTEKYGWWFCALQKDAPPTAILLGDSKTNDFFPGFAQNPDFANQNFLSIGACGAQWVDESKLSSEITVFPCSGNRPYEQMVFINNIIANDKSLRWAIIGSLPVGGFSEEYIGALKKRISFLEDNGIQVIIFSPRVSLGYDIRSCYPRLFSEASETCEVDAENHRLIMRDFAIFQRQISHSNPKTLFYDPNSFSCIRSKCLFKLDGMPMSRDQFGHLSEYASIQLINHFSRWAKLNAPGIIQPRWYIPK